MEYLAARFFVILFGVGAIFLLALTLVFCEEPEVEEDEDE